MPFQIHESYLIRQQKSNVLINEMCFDVYQLPLHILLTYLLHNVNTYLLLWPSGLRRRTFFPRSGGRWFKTQRQQRVDPAFHPFGVGEMGTSLDGCLDRRVQRF